MMMAACLRVFCFCVILYQAVIVSAEELTASPKQSFLQDNRSITLVWRYQSEYLVHNPFTQNFIFYRDGQQIDSEGGAATKTYPGKPYVDYELITKKAGLYSGKVGQLQSTANVFGINYEAAISVAKRGDNLVLKCAGGPGGTVKTWQVDGVSVDQSGHNNFFMTFDGSLLIQSIDLDDATKKIRCRQFFSEEDLYTYKTDNFALPQYKTAVTMMPVLVYDTIESSDSTYVVQMSSWKKDIMIRTCFKEDGNDICRESTANTSMELSMKHSNFTIFQGNNSLISDSFKSSEDSPEEKVQTDDSDSTAGIIVGVVLGILVVVGVVVFLVIIRRKKKLCFIESGLDTKEDPSGMKLLVPADDKNGVQDAVELKELDKKEPKNENQPALEELEAMEDEEVNPLLLDNYKKKEPKEPEQYYFGLPKYLKSRTKATEGSDNPDAVLKSDEEEKHSEKESYDLLMELDVKQPWEHFKDFASKIDDFLDDHLKLPEKPGSDISGSLYMTGKDILPRGFVSYISSSKGNCLFNSASSVLYGNEAYTIRLRLAALLDGISKSEFYVKEHFKDKDKEEMLNFMNSCLTDESLKQFDTSRQEDTSYVAEFIIQMAIREMAIPDSKCNPLQVQFLSSAIDCPILQYFQKGYRDFYGRPVKDYEVVKPAGMTGSVKGHNKECVFILWVCESQQLQKDGGRLDYVVPVVKKIHKHEKADT